MGTPLANNAVPARPASGEAGLFTVALCTRGRREAHLRQALESLGKQTDRHFETIVVDNSKAGDLRISAPEGLELRLERERKPGLDHARNRAIEQARGEFIAFIDDDCEAHPDWIRNLRTAFDDPSVTCATGRVRPARIENPVQNWFEVLSPFDRGPEEKRFMLNGHGRTTVHESTLLGTGCNMAFRRTVFHAVGKFDIALDMGTVVGGGGDLDMFARVIDAGFVALYSPQAEVLHHHRERRRQLYAQLFGYGVSVGALSFKSLLAPSGKLKRILGSQWHFAYHVSRIAWTRLRSRSPEFPPVTLSLAMLLGNALGPAFYLVSLLRARTARSP